MAQTFVKIFGDKLITKYMFDTDFNEDPLLPSPSIILDMKDKHSATVCVPPSDSSIDPYVSFHFHFLDYSNHFIFFLRIPKSRYQRHQSFPCTAITTDEFDHRRMTNIAIQVIGDNEILNTNNNNKDTIMGTNSILPYRSMLDIDEPETYYCLNVSFYQPIAQPKHNHQVSLLSMHHIIDFNNLQMLRFV